MDHKRKISGRLKIIMAGILVLAGVAGTAATVYSEETVNGIADNIIRLHIIGESNSNIDQEIKLKVRDKVMEYLSGKVDLTASVPQTAGIIKNELPNIEKVAEEVLTENGRNAGAKAEYGNFPFPAKQYENIELPAGNYNALRITLGKGEGRNWWCVIFPPLCFADSTDGKISPEEDAKLKQNLSQDQYDLITSTDEYGTVPVTFKFKVVEVVQDVKNAVAGFFGGIFG